MRHRHLLSGRCRGLRCGMLSRCGCGALAGTALHRIGLGARTHECLVTALALISGCGGRILRFVCGGCGTAGDRDNRRPNFDRLALAHQNLLHGAGVGRGQFHDGFGGLDFDENIVDADLAANADFPGEDLSLGKTFTHIREIKNLGHFMPFAREYSLSGIFFAGYIRNMEYTDLVFK